MPFLQDISYLGQGGYSILEPAGHVACAGNVLAHILSSPLSLQQIQPCSACKLDGMADTSAIFRKHSLAGPLDQYVWLLSG